MHTCVDDKNPSRFFSILLSRQDLSLSQNPEPTILASPAAQQGPRVFLCLPIPSGTPGLRLQCLLLSLPFTQVLASQCRSSRLQGMHFSYWAISPATELSLLSNTLSQVNFFLILQENILPPQKRKKFSNRDSRKTRFTSWRMYNTGSGI